MLAHDQSLYYNLTTISFFKRLYAKQYRNWKFLFLFIAQLRTDYGICQTLLNMSLLMALANVIYNARSFWIKYFHFVSMQNKWNRHLIKVKVSFAIVLLFDVVDQENMK